MIVAGFGFRRGVGLPALRAVLDQAQQGMPAVCAIAAPQDRIAELAAFADAMQLPLLPIDARSLEAMPTITQSAISRSARNTGSVAEAVALAAAGPGARLLTPRHISPDRMATCAIAQGGLST